VAEEYNRYERARIIAARALQLSMGALPLIKTKEIDPIKIARMEFEKNVLPITILNPSKRKALRFIY
jgi:DNA-directed RNA polymerase subunit K